MTGSEFRKIRRDMDLTQSQLAEKLELSVGTIITIEKSEKVGKVYELALTAFSNIQNEFEDKQND